MRIMHANLITTFPRRSPPNTHSKATTTYDKVMTSCAQLSMLSLGLSQAIGSVPYGNKTQLKNETVSELVQAGAELSTIVCLRAPGPAACAQPY